MMLPIRSIRLDFQPPENLNPDTVAAYATALRAGQGFAPVRVYFDGETYWLNNGFHRIAAAVKVGAKEIEAEIILGTYADMEAEWERHLDEILSLAS